MQLGVIKYVIYVHFHYPQHHFKQEQQEQQPNTIIRRKLLPFLLVIVRMHSNGTILIMHY